MLTDIHDVLIFAVKRPGDSGQKETKKINKALTTLAAMKISTILGVGSYKGETDLCIIAYPGNENAREKVSEIAFCRYSQDSVLHLGNRQKNGTREAVLEHTVLKARWIDCERLGMWRGVCRTDAMDCEGWTFVPSLNQFYIAA